MADKSWMWNARILKEAKQKGKKNQARKDKKAKNSGVKNVKKKK